MSKISFRLNNTVFVVALAVLFFPKFLSAETFKILGSRPMGMGGAFVAVADDALAQYWNPANLATQRKFDIEIPEPIPETLPQKYTRKEVGNSSRVLIPPKIYRMILHFWPGFVGGWNLKVSDPAV